MSTRPGLAKAAPILAGLANSLDAVEASLVAYEEEIARLTKERDEARATDIDAMTAEVVTLRAETATLTKERDDALAKLDAIIRAHNATLAELGSLRAITGVTT